MTREAFTSNQKTYLSWAVEQIYFLFIFFDFRIKMQSYPGDLVT